MNDHEKQQMWRELLEPVGHPCREEYPQPNITTAEYANQEGISRNRAYRLLEKAVSIEVMEKSPEKVLIDGVLYSLYWPKVDSQTQV